MINTTEFDWLSMEDITVYIVLEVKVKVDCNAINID